MKNKGLIGCILFLSLLAMRSYANTDTFAVYVGGAWWQTEGNGNLTAPILNGYNLSLQGSQQENNASAFLTIENTNPFVPNFTFAYGELKQNATGTFFYISTTFAINGKIDLYHFDTTAYFRPVNLPYFQLDTGLSLRLLRGEIYSTIVSSDLSSTLPIFYANAAFIVPNTGIRFTINTNVGDTGKESTRDIKGAISYESATGLGVNLGYRFFKMAINSTAIVPGYKPVDINGNILIKGPYVGLFYHF